ncbi:MAG: IS200/IS605 family transposase [Thermotogae bacterium]|nr:IS200/IS605 family transposase [Thermotogota bacterium]
MHAKYQIAYHFVWTPKYRRNILVSDVHKSLVDILYNTCNKYGFEILTLEVMPDHIHIATHGNVSSETIKEYIEGCQR